MDHPIERYRPVKTDGGDGSFDSSIVGVMPVTVYGEIQYYNNMPILVIDKDEDVQTEDVLKLEI